jgi:hypothetical protein
MSPYHSAIWRVLEGGDLHTPEEIADEACIPRGAIRNILSEIKDARIGTVSHPKMPTDLTLYRRADRTTSLRDIHRKLHSLQRERRKRAAKKPADASVAMQDFMIRFCRKGSS